MTFKIAALFTASLAVAGAAIAAAPGDQSADAVARGRYLVRIAGCNDCHTPGYGPAAGAVDESLWLTGDRLGFTGPWGTTYATNLRLLLAGMSADDWVAHARAAQARPPMPWFNLQAMTDDDLRAIHAFVTALGPAGQPAPDYLPPGTTAPGPVVQFP